MVKQDPLDKIIAEMESEGKQAKQLNNIEYFTEMEEVVRRQDKGPGSSSGAPGCLTKSEIKEMEEIDKKYFEKAMEERER